MEDFCDIDFSELTKKDVNAPVTIDGRKVYGTDSYFVTLRLTDFFGARYERLANEDTGEEEFGVFIPIRPNNILVSPKKKAIVTFKAEVSQIPSTKYTHVLSPILEREHYVERKSLGYDVPFMGFMRPTGFKKQNKNKRYDKY